MNDLAYTLTLLPDNNNFSYICVRLWSAKGKAVESIKFQIQQLNGYIYPKDDNLHDLYEWVRQHVEDAQTMSKSKYRLCMDQRTQPDHYGHKCQVINVYLSRMNGDSFADIATIYAMPITGTLSIGSFLKSIVANPPFDTKKGGEK